MLYISNPSTAAERAGDSIKNSAHTKGLPAQNFVIKATTKVQINFYFSNCWACALINSSVLVSVVNMEFSPCGSCGGSPVNGSPGNHL